MSFSLWVSLNGEESTPLIYQHNHTSAKRLHALRTKFTFISSIHFPALIFPPFAACLFFFIYFLNYSIMYSSLSLAFFYFSSPIQFLYIPLHFLYIHYSSRKLAPPRFFPFPISLPLLLYLPFPILAFFHFLLSSLLQFLLFCISTLQPFLA